MTSIETTLVRESTDAAPWSLLTVMAVAALLALPALWSGYPLVYYDSPDYVVMPFRWDMPIYRTGAYGVFALVGRISHSLWTLVLLQSLIVAYVLYETFRLFVPGAARRMLVAFTILLALGTGLSWFTSEIMPDAFTGATVLALAVLVFEAGRLEPWRRSLLTAILALGIAVHTSHFAIIGGLILCLLAARWPAAWGWPFLVPRLRMALIAFVVALAMAVGSNWLMTGRAFLAQPSAVLTLGLLVQDGLAKRYLDDVCKQPGPDKPRLCMARNRLPATANDFLWHDDDFWKLGGWTGLQNEAHRIVEGCLHKYPLSFVWASLKLTFQQLLMVQTGDGVAPMQFFIEHAIKRYYPQELPAFWNARQQSGIDFSLINAVQVPILLGSLVALLPLLWLSWRQRDRVSTTIAAFTLLTLAGNAFVCGVLSNPNERYQSRIAWIAVLAVILASVRLSRRAGPGAPLRIRGPVA